MIQVKYVCINKLQSQGLHQPTHSDETSREDRREYLLRMIWMGILRPCFSSVDVSRDLDNYASRSGNGMSSLRLILWRKPKYRPFLTLSFQQKISLGQWIMALYEHGCEWVRDSLSINGYYCRLTASDGMLEGCLRYETTHIFFDESTILNPFSHHVIECSPHSTLIFEKQFFH